LAVKVLDERLFHGRHIVSNANDGGNRAQTGTGRRTPTTLARNQLEFIIPSRANQDGLEYAYRSNR
jgi:hypothetical protein